MVILSQRAPKDVHSFENTPSLSFLTYLMPITFVARIYTFEKPADHGHAKTRAFPRNHLSDAGVSVRLGMLEFRDVRQGIQAETEILAKPFCTQPVVYPEGFQMRATRISFASYLLDTLEKMIKVAETRRNENLLGRVETLRISVRKLLDKGYFEKGAEQIKAEYSAFEPALLECASHCGIKIL